VRSQVAETGPPLGTVLGNLGANAVKFVKEFNEYTKELPSYFLLKVQISIFYDRSYKFSVLLPTTGFILSFIKSKVGKIKYGVYIKDVIQLALLKFPDMPLKQSMAIILGSVHSCNFCLIPSNKIL